MPNTNISRNMNSMYLVAGKDALSYLHPNTGFLLTLLTELHLWGAQEPFPDSFTCDKSPQRVQQDVLGAR